MTVLVCDKIIIPEEEKSRYIRKVNSLNESEKYFECVLTATNPKDERNYQLRKLGNGLEILDQVVIL